MTVSGDDLGALYLETRARVAALASGLTADEEARPVPATPAWTVHDLVAHLAGITEDALAGRMDGAPGEAWTAAQVERGRTRPLAELLAAWEANAPAFAAALGAAGPLAGPAVMDVATHEQDLRGALGRPGARDNAVIRWAMPGLVQRWSDGAAAAGLAPVRAVTEVGVLQGSPGDPGVTVEAPAWELFRVAFGRRSAAQVRALTWHGDPEAYLPHLFVFGPADADLVE